MIVIICVAFSIALYIWTVASISYGTMYPMHRIYTGTYVYTVIYHRRIHHLQ